MGQRFLGPSGAGAAGRRHSSSCRSLLLDAASPFVWRLRGNRFCYMQCLLGPVNFGRLALLWLHTTFKSHGHSKSQLPQVLNVLSLSELAVLLQCSRYGPSPSLPQEGFVCQMCLCSLDSWLFSEIFQLGYEQTVKMWPFRLSWAWGAVTRQPLAHVWLASREVWKMGRVSMSFLGRGAEENNVITDVWRCILFSPGIYCEVWMVSVTMNVAFL